MSFAEDETVDAAPLEVLVQRYELLGLVGTGGMGNVYRARDRQLDEIVAVKVLRPELLGAPGALERFRRELKLARRVTHPNVARVFDMNEDGGDKLLTMEFVEGESLGALVRREGRLSVERTIAIMSAVAAGVGAAHAAGVVHRDLKPDNVLLGRDGRVVVTDFGVARAADGDAARTGGGFVGTPAYMAPEQIESPGAVDARADIYAFGAILYEMLVGAMPFEGDSALSIAASRLLRPPPDPRAKRPELPARLAELVLACMARSPDARPATVGAIAQAFATLTLAPSEAVSEAKPRVEVGAAAMTEGKRVAVLPVTNAGLPEDDYVAEGLTEDLIDALSVAPGLRVRARGVVARHRVVDRDAREVGRELDVDVVVDASVRRVGASFRVAARVISVSEGFQLWAKRFDVPEAELLQSCDGIAHAVANALGVDLPSPERKPAPTAESVDAYLRAREALRRGFDRDRTNVVELFERARALAPDDPRVLAGYGAALLRSFPTPGVIETAREVVRRAMELAPAAPDSGVVSAQLALAEGRWASAVTTLRATLRTAPNHPDAHDVLGRVLVEADVHAGASHLEMVLAHDPSYGFARAALARFRLLHGDVERALATMDDGSGKRVLLPAWARFALWRRDATLAAAVRAELVPDSPQLLVASQILDLIISGTEPTFLFSAWADAAIPKTTRLFLAQMDAEIAGFLGQRERLLASLAVADEAGLPDWAWLRRCPLLDAHRGDPAFEVIAARVRERGEAISTAFTAPIAVPR